MLRAHLLERPLAVLSRREPPYDGRTILLIRTAHNRYEFRVDGGPAHVCTADDLDAAAWEAHAAPAPDDAHDEALRERAIPRAFPPPAPLAARPPPAAASPPLLPTPPSPPAAASPALLPAADSPAASPSASLAAAAGEDASKGDTSVGTRGQRPVRRDDVRRLSVLAAPNFGESAR